jgi:outer membrane receptor protein involved in Fe transport
MKRGLTLALLASASVLACTAAQAAAAADAPAASEVTEVVVTGSRTITNGNDSPTPLTVIPTDQLSKLAPTSVVDAVNLMPALQGSQSTSSNPGGGQRNGAAAYINLRDMGDLRTLVLMDGHRVVKTINQNEANLDSWVIPQLLIKRVDVVTGGVSAVYGSDAISGVVNFITDTSFEGLKVQGQTGTSTYSDDNINDVGFAVGRKFLDGRAHLEFSYEYHDDPGILNQADRPFFAKSLGGAGLGTAASPYRNVLNERISSTSFGGLINSGPLAGQQFATNGVLSAFNHGIATGTANVESGGDGGWYDTASIKSSLIFHQVFARGDYDFTNTVHGYLQLSATTNHTADAFRAPLEPVTLGYNNAFIPAGSALAAQAALTPTGTFSFSKLFNIPGTADQYTSTYMLHGGLDGTLGDYKWKLDVGQSASRIKAENEVNVDQGKFLAAINSVKTASGSTVCNASLTNANYASCVPLNLFGPTAFSQQALNYVLAQTYNINTTYLTDVDASITGAPVSTWAGPVNMALSAEFRQEAWDIKSNAGPNDPIDCGGIQFGCTASGLTQTPRWLQNTQPGQGRKTQRVSEIAYEADAPLLKDKPFAEAVNINGALRYTDYSTSGSVWTWKVGGLWRVNDDVTFRGTVSRDIRAPNLFELFSPTTIAPTTITDPLTGIAARVPVPTTSNPNLVPERANTFTGGVVWTPHNDLLRGLSFSIDAFHIEVNNAITLLSGNSTSLLSQCANSTANPLCAQLIIRPFPITNTTAANFPTSLIQTYENIASFDTYGADFETNYATKVFDHGLNLRALVSWQPHLVFNQGPAGIIDLGNTATGVNLYPASPAVKYTLIAQYDVTDQLNLGVLIHGQGAMKAVGVVEGQAKKIFNGGSDRDPAIAYTNLTLTYRLKPGVLGDTSLFANVANVFNQQPAVRYAGANSSPGVGLSGFFPPNGEDIVGRYYTVGFKSKFF